MSARASVRPGPVISQHNCDMKNKSPPELLTVQEVPDFAKEFSIETGYRACLGYDGCIKSIFKLHNETVNIWTHLLGFLFFFGLMVKDLVWTQEHIRDRTDYNATLLQLLTYQVGNFFFYIFLKLQTQQLKDFHGEVIHCHIDRVVTISVVACKRKTL